MYLLKGQNIMLKKGRNFVAVEMSDKEISGI